MKLSKSAIEEIVVSLNHELSASYILFEKNLFDFSSAHLKKCNWFIQKLFSSQIEHEKTSAAIEQLREKHSAVLEKTKSNFEPSLMKKNEYASNLSDISSLSQDISKKILTKNKNSFLNATTVSFMLLVAMLSMMGRVYYSAYTKPELPEVTLPSHYYQIEEFLFANAWIELGKDGRTYREKLGHPIPENTRIHFENFTAGKWHHSTDIDQITWHLITNSPGKISIDFPAGTNYEAVQIFLTDSDSVLRNTRIYSDETDIIADEFHQGKWFSVPFSRSERDRGRKVISIIPLTGNGATISALRIVSIKGKS